MQIVLNLKWDRATLKGFAACRRWCEEFVAVEKHPVLYLGFFAANLTVLVAYQIQASTKSDVDRWTEARQLQSLLYMTPSGNENIASTVSTKTQSELASERSSRSCNPAGTKSCDSSKNESNWLKSDSLHLASLYTLSRVPKLVSTTKQAKAPSAVIGAGTVSASGLHTSSLISSNQFLPPPPPVVTMSAGRPRSKTPSPYLVPPPPPMLPGMEVAQWSGASNAGLPAAPPYAVESPGMMTEVADDWSSSRSSSRNDGFRSRMRRHARQIIVTR